MDPIAREKLNAQLEDALQNKDIATFHRLLDAQTDLDENVNLHTLHRVATYNGVDTFRAVVERFPECKDYEFGHTGNAVGIATMSGDIELLKYLLDEVGHRANAGCWCYRPVLFLVHDKPDKKDIYNILKAHGATMEGEGDCYQVSHRRWNGKLCWHKHGAAKTKCEWKTPELVFYKAGEEPEWYKELKSV